MSDFNAIVDRYVALFGLVENVQVQVAAEGMRLTGIGVERLVSYTKRTIAELYTKEQLVDLVALYEKYPGLAKKSMDMSAKVGKELFPLIMNEIVPIDNYND